MLQTVSPAVLNECKALRREGKLTEALARLQDALRRRQLDPTVTNAAGRFLRKALASADAGEPDLRLLLLGQCTTSWLAITLTAEAWAGGKAALVDDGGYDSVIQDLANVSNAVDVVVIVPWHQRLLTASDRPHAHRI